MTLTETLQIKERYLQFEDLRALTYCEKRWQQEGYPAKRWELVNFIERMLQELKASGIGYPKVLLLRKKEIQSRAFIPEESSAIRDSEEACLSCHGTGWRAIKHPQSAPSYIPCNCKAGDIHRTQLSAYRRQAS